MELDQLTVLLVINDQNFYVWMADYVYQLSGLKVTPEECVQYVQQTAQSGDQLAQQLIEQYIKLYLSLVQTAAAGTKLDYIRRMRGKCPADYQVEYYKQGRKICKRCVKKRAQGGAMSKDFTVGATGENAVNAFKKAYAYRLGGVTKYQSPAGPIDVIKGVVKTILPDSMRKRINSLIGRDNTADVPIHPETTTVIQGGDMVNGAIYPEGYRKTIYTDPNGELYVEEIIPAGITHRELDRQLFTKENMLGIYDDDPYFKEIYEPADTLYSYPYGIVGTGVAADEPTLVHYINIPSFKAKKASGWFNPVFYMDSRYPDVKENVRKVIYGK